MLDIALPVLNKEQTKKNVLQALKKYRLFLSNIDEREIKLCVSWLIGWELR